MSDNAAVAAAAGSQPTTSFFNFSLSYPAVSTGSKHTRNTAYYKEAVHIPCTDEAIAIAALGCLGGRDISIASTMMTLSEHGWGLWEEEARHLSTVSHSNPTLPSWFVSSLRGGMRSEMVLCSYGLTPRHGELLGEGLNPFSRLQRLVLMGNLLGCQGAAGIAAGLCNSANDVTEVVLDKCGIGDVGAAALAATLSSPNCRIRILQLEENDIRDDGASAFATQVAAGRRCSGAQVMLGGNYISKGAGEALIAAYFAAPSGSVSLTSRFFPQQRVWPTGGATGSMCSSTLAPAVWRSYSTPTQRVEPPPPPPRGRARGNRR